MVACFHRHGHSLLEVLVALTILSLGLLAQAGAITLIVRLVDRGHRADRAATIAVTRLEELRLAAAGGLPPCQGGSVAGTQQHLHIHESWTGARTGGHATAWVITTRVDRSSPIIDTVSSVLPC
jgi:prepilin-type N-terminal cleavage/methylation domain-containing protein